MTTPNPSSSQVANRHATVKTRSLHGRCDGSRRGGEGGRPTSAAAAADLQRAERRAPPRAEEAAPPPREPPRVRHTADGSGRVHYRRGSSARRAAAFVRSVDLHGLCHLDPGGGTALPFVHELTCARGTPAYMCILARAPVQQQISDACMPEGSTYVRAVADAIGREV